MHERHKQYLLFYHIHHSQAITCRFFPAYAKIRDLIASGSIGDVRMVMASYGMSIMHKDRVSKSGNFYLFTYLFPHSSYTCNMNREREQGGVGTQVERGIGDVPRNRVPFSPLW